MHDSADYATNLLGATALVINDLVLTKVTKAADVSASGAAALVVLTATAGLSVTELGRRVGLSQSAAARMVDTLEADNLVERRPGLGKWVTVHPTAAGLDAARRLLVARGNPLLTVVGSLDEAEQRQLGQLLAKLLTRLYEQVGNAELMCRLCDRVTCTTDAVCPVGAAERDARS
jgi:DNA-binding MarR family transcriptional regulator